MQGKNVTGKTQKDVMTPATMQSVSASEGATIFHALGIMAAEEKLPLAPNSTTGPLGTTSARLASCASGACGFPRALSSLCVLVFSFSGLFGADHIIICLQLQTKINALTRHGLVLVRVTKLVFIAAVVRIVAWGEGGGELLGEN